MGLGPLQTRSIWMRRRQGVAEGNMCPGRGRWEGVGQTQTRPSRSFTHIHTLTLAHAALVTPQGGAEHNGTKRGVTAGCAGRVCRSRSIAHGRLCPEHPGKRGIADHEAGGGSRAFYLEG